MIRTLAVGVLCAGALLSSTEAQAQTDLERCKAGDRRACEVVGIPKAIVGDLVAMLRESDSRKKTERRSTFYRKLEALASPDAYVACFRLNLWVDDIEKRAGAERVEALALTDPDPDVRKRALGKVNDGSVVAKVATQDADAEVRLVAAGLLTDVQVLEQLALHDADTSVQVAALGNGSLQADAAAFERVLAAVPVVLKTRALLVSGYWVLGPGAAFHQLPIEPAEGIEVLRFQPNGKVRMLAGTVSFAERSYEVVEGTGIVLRIGQGSPGLSVDVTASTLTLSGSSGKATYRKVADIYR